MEFPLKFRTKKVISKFGFNKLVKIVVGVTVIIVWFSFNSATTRQYKKLYKGAAIYQRFQIPVNANETLSTANELQQDKDTVAQLEEAVQVIKNSQDEIPASLNVTNQFPNEKGEEQQIRDNSESNLHHLPSNDTMLPENGQQRENVSVSHNITFNKSLLDDEQQMRNTSDWIDPNYGMKSYDHVPLYVPPGKKVLALVSPPGLHAGYRNQMMRFLGLITHALREDFKYILLNSLVCVAPDVVTNGVRNRKIHLLPFASLFDIDHWNTFSNVLPQLVDYHESSEYNCWKMGNDNETTKFLNDKPDLSGSRKELIQQGSFVTLFEETKLIYSGEFQFNLLHLRQRSNNATETARECEGNPVPAGGGPKANVLWKMNHVDVDEEKETGKFPFDAKANFHKALRPKKKWRDLGQSCIGNETTKYVGLHLRAEMEIFGHKCKIENNLTKIFSDLDDFLRKYHEENEDSALEVINIATYRKGLEANEGKTYRFYKANIDENLIVFNNVTDGGIQQFGGREFAIKECGQPFVDKYLEENPDEKKYNYGVMLSQVINYEVLVEADVFVGAKGSSFSEDIWMTRYHRGKGSGNFQYAPEGIVPVGEGGFPEPFDCWR